MREDHAIVLQLRPETNGVIGDQLIVVLPGDPKYKEVLRHVDGLRVGEYKQVLPWPDFDRE